jgi:predicted DNA-binding transcriptional regulator YafY
MSAKTLTPAERQKEILEHIRKGRRVLATDMAQEFQTPKTRFAVLCAIRQLRDDARVSVGAR